MSLGSEKTILLVEDEAIIALSMAKILEAFGYKIIAAYSGEEAIEKATGDPGADLVLMDIDLGQGCDGTEAARKILETRHVPIVFLTSHSEREMVERVKGITRYGYIIKNSGNFVLQSSIEMAFELFEANRVANENAIALRNSEERFRSIVENSGAGYLFLDSTGVLRSVNRAWLRMYKYSSAEDVIGKTISEFEKIDSKSAAEWFDRIMTGDTESLSGEFRRANADGSIGFHSYNMRLLTYQGRTVGAEGFIIDTTRQKKAEEELDFERYLFSSLFDAIPDHIYFKDMQSRFIRINAALAKTFALKNFQRLSAKPTSIISPYPSPKLSTTTRGE